MKKGCLIGLIVLLVLIVGVAIVAGVGFVKVNQQYGISEAPPASYEQFVNKNTRVRLLFNPDKLNDLIAHYLPPDALPLPSWLPYKQNQLIPMLMPREIALLTGSDFAKGQIDLTFFINERRLGPLIAQAADNSNIFKSIKQVKWDSELMTAPQRGVLKVGGAIAIPDGLENKVLETWQHDIKGEPVTIQGGHLIEAAIDNRSGDIFTLIASAQQASGQDWRALLQDPIAKTAIAIVQKVVDFRLSGDFVSNDSAKIVARVGAEPDAGPQLEFLAGMGIPALATQLEDMYGLKLTGQPKWNASEKALIGEFSITGFERLIRQQIQAALPKAAAASAPKQ